MAGGEVTLTSKPLQVVNKDDDNWWQAVKVHSESESERPRQAGLIPSLVLQERRRAFINQDMVCCIVLVTACFRCASVFIPVVSVNCKLDPHLIKCVHPDGRFENNRFESLKDGNASLR